MNQERFLEACRLVTADRERSGIGTLGEKTLHAVLKRYLEPDEGLHEIKIGPYYADICGEGGIVEIQTRQFDKLRGKLAAFLPDYAVTVAYPVPFNKRLIWIDEETGETTPPRRSPKRGTAQMIFPELYKIKGFLGHPHLSIRILLVDVDEYRRLNGWSQDKKRGSWRSDRIPVGLQGELLLSCPGDYGLLIPPELPPSFSSREFAGAARLRLPAAQAGLNVLHELGAVSRVGKRGNAYLYEQCYFPDGMSE